MPRPSVRRSESEVEKWQESIKEFVVCVLERRSSELSYSLVHQNVYSMVTRGEHGRLFRILEVLIPNKFDDWENILKKSPDNALISTLHVICSDFRNFCSIIPRMFQLYDERHEGFPSSRAYLFDIFRRIFADKRLLTIISIAMVESFQKATTDETFSVEPLRQIYYTLQLISRDNEGNGFFQSQSQLNDYKGSNQYTEEFHGLLKGLLVETYSQLFEREFHASDFSTFLNMAKKKVIQDEKLLSCVVGVNATEFVIEIYDALFFSHEAEITKGTNPPIYECILSEDPTAAIWLVSIYIKASRCLDPLINGYCDTISQELLHISESFNENLSAAQIAKLIGQMIELILSRRNKFSTIFRSFTKIYDSSLMKCWNNPKFNIVESFNTYIDYSIRNQFKDINDEDKDNFPKICALFYMLTEDKFTFRERFQAFFVRRLIKYGNSNLQLENPIIDEIRQTQANDFMLIRERLVESIMNSQDILREFNDTHQSKVRIHPLIFRRSDYPLPKDEMKWLPGFISGVNESFCSFYKAKKEKTQLILLAEPSVIEGKMRFPPNSKSKDSRTYTITADIVCSSLLQFVAEQKHTSLQNILDNLMFDHLSIKRYVAKLCKAPSNLLKRVKFEGKTMANTDEFEINPDFFSKNLKLSIPPNVSQRKADTKLAEADAGVNKEKVIQASVVRFLKMRNRLKQQELEQLVTQNLAAHFRVEIGMLRKVITENELSANQEKEAYFKREGSGENEYLVYIQG